MREAGPRVYTLAVRLAGNPSDGEDIAQEAFVLAYRHWASFRGEAHFATWMHRICVNVWKNQMRARKRRAFWKHISLGWSATEDDDTPPVDPPAQEPSLDHALERDETRTSVQGALAQLEEIDRAALLLRDMNDQPYEDISRSLGIPLGTVKSRLARARRRLKTLMEGRKDP
jgi:RNA polymerase sigma-70 factor (ECF subfamily)